ncbi:UNVERIFIED_CONTAM: hypothetical protein Sindi_2494100 [Sesamum indicum]
MTLQRSSQVDREKSVLSQCSITINAQQADGSGSGLFDPIDRKDADPRLNDGNALNEGLFCAPHTSAQRPALLLQHSRSTCCFQSHPAASRAILLFKSRPGSRSSATPSESASGSSSGSVPGSAFGSAHDSFSTSPKRNKKFPISKITDEQAGPSTLAKFQDKLAKNLWEAVVSRVRTPVFKIREKYHIPSDYDIVIPATFDRMHRPLEGFNAFSIKHLDAGLRFPLAPPIASILNKLGLCPMQLSPNSISHIGFLYLSAKPDCGYLSALKSNVGVWLDRYIFIRSPRGVWPFKNEWTKYKPVPKISGGGLEGDQINSLMAYKYDPKKLLTEKVLKKSGLSPASLHIEESLDSLIMSSRNAMRMKAAQNKVRKGKQVAASSNLPPSSPAPVPSKARVPASPAGQRPITVDSEETPSDPAGHHGYNSSKLELNLDEVSSDQGAEQEKRDPSGEERSKKRKRSSPKRGSGDKATQKPSDKGEGKEPAEPSSPHKPKPQRSNFLSRTAREAAEKTSQSEDRDRFLRLAQLASCWEDNRAALRGDQPLPKWDNISSSALYGKAGGDSFDLYDSLTSIRDQGSLVMNNPIRLEEFGFQAHLQALTFFWSIALTCTYYRKSFISTDQKLQAFKAQLVEWDQADLRHADDMMAFGDKIKSLEAELDAARKEKEIILSEKEVALSKAKKEAFEAGREVGLIEGHKQGLEEGQVVCRLIGQGLRDLPAQIEKLGRFQESFDRGQLDITLDGDLQPYPAEPDLKDDDEFMALRDELQAEADT